MFNSSLKTKTCIKCNKEKPISEFHKEKAGKFGVRSDCKECHCKRVKLYYSIHQNERLEYNHKYWDEHKTQLIENRKEYHKEYREKNKESLFKKNKDYRNKNRNVLNKK